MVAEMYYHEMKRVKDTNPLNEEEASVVARCMASWLAYKDKTGETQAGMADKLGFGNQSAFSQYIHGRVPPNIKFILKFCSITGDDPAMIWPENADTLTASNSETSRLNRKIALLSEEKRKAIELIVDGMTELNRQ